MNKGYGKLIGSYFFILLIRLGHQVWCPVIKAVVQLRCTDHLLCSSWTKPRPLWSLSPQTSAAPSIIYQTPLPFGKHLTRITGPNIAVTTPFMLTQTWKLFPWIQQKTPKFYIRSLFRFQVFLKHALNLQNVFDLPMERKSATTMHFLLQISHTQWTSKTPFLAVCRLRWDIFGNRCQHSFHYKL